MLKLLNQLGQSKKGVGNAAMGMVFKSIYLAAGRTTTKKATRNNDLNGVDKILLNLMERPEPLEDDFFKEDIYTSSKFN